MPLNIIDTSYPICDTDIWIKVAKLNDVNLIFDKFSKAYIADAVHEELLHKDKECTEEFGCAVKYFEIERDKERVYKISLANSNLFNTKAKAATLKAFKEHRIVYDEKNNAFVHRENLGEMVTAIYAAVHGLPIVLSDDSDSDSFINKNYSYIPVIKLKELLDYRCYSPTECKMLLIKANESLFKGTIDKRSNEITIKSFKDLKSAMKQKNA